MIAVGDTMRTRAGKLMLAMFCIVVSLRVSPCHAANNRSRTEFQLEIRPAAELRQTGTEVLVLIRLAPGTTATLSIGTSCAIPQPYVIGTMRASGTYRFSVAPEMEEGARRACLRSTDGVISRALELMTNSATDPTAQADSRH